MVIPGATIFDHARLLAKYTRGLRSYLSRPLNVEDALALFDRQFQQREDSFLHVLKHAVYGDPRSPYRRLLEWADAEFGDVEAIVRANGVERALEALYAAGVWVSLEEFKGRRSIQRSGLEIPAQAGDFDNPLLNVQLYSQTSGSRSHPRVLSFALEHMTDDVPTHALFLEAFGVRDYPLVLWRPIPPGAAGIRRALIHAKLGKVNAHWFSQSATMWPRAPLPSVILNWVTVCGGRLWGGTFPVPQHVPLDQAGRVARWIAARKRDGTALHVTTNASSGLRICRAAREEGLDIAGTFFCMGGEPYTEHANRVVEDVGGRAGSFYSMTEIGQIGSGCADGAAVDDVHLMRNKVAVIQPTAKDSGGSATPGLFLTSLRASAPKILLNVESGDTGVMEQRHCGCASARPGLEWHVHTIRSYEKLTTEGMHFLGSDLLRLVEQILPAAFGGVATDYQFWEDRRDGRPRVAVVVSPRLGARDENRVVDTVLAFLGSHSRGDRMMADLWRQGQTLRVLRCEPVATSSAKVHALHVLSEDDTNDSRRSGERSLVGQHERHSVT